MTRYDKYLRSCGYKLETDYPCLPYNHGSYSIECVRTSITDNGIVITTFTNVDEPIRLLVQRNGNAYPIDKDGNPPDYSTYDEFDDTMIGQSSSAA